MVPGAVVTGRLRGRRYPWRPVATVPGTITLSDPFTYLKTYLKVAVTARDDE
jgi:hypothetical protein